LETIRTPCASTMNAGGILKDSGKIEGIKVKGKLIEA
jgi:hypothetical protein